MKTIVLTILLSVSASSMNPHSVNLALETSILFEPKNTKYDLTIIKNIQGFLDKLHALVSPTAGSAGNQIQLRSTDNKHIISDFLIDLSVALLNYSDGHLNNLTITFDDIMDEFYYKEAIFHEVFIESRLRNFIRTLTKDWRNTEPNVLKKRIENCSRTGDPELWKFLKKMNKYYDTADEKILKKIVKKIVKYPNINEDLKEVITNGLKYIIFDHYNALNYTSKLKLANRLRKLTKHLTKNYKNQVLDPELKIDFRKTMKVESGNINLLDRFGRNKNYETKRQNGSQKELFLNKNVEVFIQDGSKINNHL